MKEGSYKVKTPKVKGNSASDKYAKLGVHTSVLISSKSCKILNLLTLYLRNLKSPNLKPQIWKDQLETNWMLYIPRCSLESPRWSFGSLTQSLLSGLYNITQYGRRKLNPYFYQQWWRNFTPSGTRDIFLGLLSKYNHGKAINLRKGREPPPKRLFVH